MDSINDVLQEDDREKLEFYLDYIELIIEMFKKRSLDTSELKNEKELIIKKMDSLS